MNNKLMKHYLLRLGVMGVTIGLPGLALAERDPTQPLNYSGAGERSTQPGLLVQGIFISPSKRIALIDGHFLVVGDKTRLGILVAILKDRVVIKQNNVPQVFFMANVDVRKEIR